MRQVINDSWQAQGRQEVCQFGKTGRFGVHHDTPTKLTNLCCNELYFLEGRVFDQALDEVKPDAPRSCISASSPSPTATTPRAVFLK